MQCVTPMFRLYNPYIKKDSNAKIVPRSEVMGSMLDFSPNYISYCLDKMNSHLTMTSIPKRYQTIPCGKCYACKLTKSAEWATRIMLECKESEYNYWITLTYDDNHLPDDGSLDPEHVNTFINSLRQYFKREKQHTGIRYFYAGEYGEQNGRAHYHLCLFNLPLDIAQFYNFHLDERYCFHWKSKEIERFWNKGIIDITELEWSNAAYTARYTMKKLFDNNEEYEKEGKHKEYIRMSRMPGIGMNYFNQNMDKIYEHDEMIMKTVKGNVGSFKPPKAFDRKFKDLYPDQWTNIQKSRQKAAERSRKLQKELSDYNDLKKLEIAENEITRKINLLPREL